MCYRYTYRNIDKAHNIRPEDPTTASGFPPAVLYGDAASHCNALIVGKLSAAISRARAQYEGVRQARAAAQVCPSYFVRHH